jgi:hypothetical protein
MKKFIIAAMVGLFLGTSIGIAKADESSFALELRARDEAHAIELTRNVRHSVAGCESARWEHRGASFTVVCEAE